MIPQQINQARIREISGRLRYPAGNSVDIAHPLAILTPRRAILVALGIISFAAFIRGVLAVTLTRQGFFIGEAVDSFLRTERAWYWSAHPFFITGPPMWPPLQYALIGTVFRILSPIVPGSQIAVPILFNQLLFLSSLTLLFLAARRLVGLKSAIIACLLAATMTYDLWIGLSAQPEPLLTLLTISLGYVFILDRHSPRARHLLAIGVIACLLQATHYTGWFVSASAIIYLAYVLVFQGRSHALRNPYSFAAIIGLFLSITFVAAWLWANYRTFDDPFQFLRWTADIHAQYSWMPISTRLLAVPLASFDAEPILTVLAVAAIPIALVSNPKLSIFLAPALLLALLLTLANLLLLGPARYMPRATLPILWLCLPFIAALMFHIPNLGNTRIPVLPFAATLAIISMSVFRNDEYTNRISQDLRDIAASLSYSLAADANTAVSNTQPWADQHALAVLSLYPDRLEFLPNEDFAEVFLTDNRLIILNDPRLMSQAIEAGMAIAGNPDYVLASRARAEVRDESPPSSFLWTVNSPNTFLVHPDYAVDALGFRSSEISPGDYASVVTHILSDTDGCYLLTARVKDFSPESGLPWQFLHQIAANNIVLWSYDPTAAAFDGWQNISLYLMPTSSQLKLELRILAVNPPGPDADWWTPSEVSFQNFQIAPCS